MNRTEYIKKEELISLMAQTSGVSKSTCDLVLSAFCEAAKQTMKEGKGIQIPRFAKIFPVYKEARKGRNPMTGEEIEIAASVSAKMLPLSGLKNALNGKE